MANITTNTLKIGSNNLILRDADAQAKVATNTQNITSLKEDLQSITNGEIKVYSTGYIDCAKATIDINTVVENQYYKHFVDTCVEGDIYVINVTGSASAKPWAFVDASGKRLSFYQSVGGGWVCDNQIIVAPANSAYLISNHHINSSVHPLAYKYLGNVYGQSLRLSNNNAVHIAENSNFDDYTTEGNYKVTSASIASTISNIPESAGGRLVVLTLANSDSVHQLYISTNGNWYTREKTSNGWMAWKTIASSSYVDGNIAALGKPIPTLTNGVSQIPTNSDLNNYKTAGTYIVYTISISRTIANVPEYYSGRIIVMATSASAIISQVFITNTNHIYTRIFSGSWTDWVRVADFDATVSNKNATKGAYNALYAMIKNSQYDIAYANAFTPLSLKNYIGNTQNVHPKVLYFADGFGSHKYWMAYTPYPYSNDAYENPCVAYSDDGYTWQNIEGNPLDDPNGNGYNSDTHLVYRSDTQTLECWYRYIGASTQSPREETIYRQTTTDGITWTAKELVYSNNSGDYSKLLSPAVIIDGGKYCIWVVNSTKINYYEAPLSNVKNWTYIREYTIGFNDDDTAVNPWHIDVIKDGSTYAILAMCRNNTNIDSSKCSLFIATSSNNVTYNTPLKVVGGADNWDKYMYRSSVVKVGDKYRIYYSASGGGTTNIYNNAVWGIGVSESDTLTSGYIGQYM